MEKILRYVYSSKKLKSVLNAVSDFSVPVFLGAFVALSFLSYMMGLVFFLKTLIFSAVAFILVTLVRRFIRAKRPYELYSFYKEKPRGKKGDSFPSRHVFSAFLIATLFYSFSLLASILLLVAGVLLALSRVLLGIHFPRDVIAGGAIGIISGIIGILLLSL